MFLAVTVASFALIFTILPTFFHCTVKKQQSTVAAAKTLEPANTKTTKTGANSTYTLTKFGACDISKLSEIQKAAYYAELEAAKEAEQGVKKAKEQEMLDDKRLTKTAMDKSPPKSLLKTAEVGVEDKSVFAADKTQGTTTATTKTKQTQMGTITTNTKTTQKTTDTKEQPTTNKKDSAELATKTTRSKYVVREHDENRSAYVGADTKDKDKKSGKTK